MESASMLALGVFVGSIVTLGIRRTDDWTKPSKIVASAIATALAGAVLPFIEFVGGASLREPVLFYPIGLLLAYMWVFASDAVVNTQAAAVSKKFIGWLHLVGVGSATLLAMALLLSPGLRELLP